MNTRKKISQKHMNALIILLVVLGFLFGEPPTLVAFIGDVPEYATGVFDVVDTTEGNLAFYNASRGFFLLPPSANGIPDGALPADNPIIALAGTIILSDSSGDASGLVIYRIDETLWVNTFVGASNESAHAASYFGIGDFVIVMTAGPDQCADLTLNECRQSQYFLKEIPFSIQ